MMGLDPGMAIVGLVCVLGVPLVLLLAVYVGARAMRVGGRAEQIGSARGLLERRLAEGAIDVDEYYERDSALRSTEATGQKRR